MAEPVQGAQITDENGDGRLDFADFVAANNYQFGPDGDHTPQQYALSVAMNEADGMAEITDDSVAINQTINAAIVALAQADDADPTRGQMNYVAFIGSRNEPRTCIFTENVTIKPDGTVQSQLQTGECNVWQAASTAESKAYYSLVERFGHAAADKPSLFKDFAQSAGMALGGEETAGGELEIRHGDAVSIASAADLNGTTGIELDSSARETQLRLFRENADAMTEIGTSAARFNSNSPTYNKISQMTPGLYDYTSNGLTPKP